MTSIAQIQTRSLGDPEGFWGEVAEDIDWIERWDRVLYDSNRPFCRWAPGATLNPRYKAGDRVFDLCVR